MPANPHQVALEPATQAFVEGAEILPYFFTLAPEKARRYLEELQSTGTPRPDVAEEWLVVSGGPTGDVKTRIIRPLGVDGPLPVILYIHGAGFVFGSATTHDRLVRELADGVGAAIVFPEYELSPEHRYPVALEQCHTVAHWIVAEGETLGLDPGRLAIAGDQMGGAIAAALTHLTRRRGTVEFTYQALFYPATDAGFDTESYHRFAEGYSMRREQNIWFWDQYASEGIDRSDPTVCPLRATPEELAPLPPALVITAEADCLRDEGEQYASALRSAGVPVLAIRYSGVINGFMMLDAMRDTLASTAARTQAILTLRTALSSARTAVPVFAP